MKILATFKDPKSNQVFSTSGKFDTKPARVSLYWIKDQHGRLFDCGDDQDEELIETAFASLWEKSGHNS